MSFTLSGSTITQSGTDTSLAGLSAIAGITTTTIGNLTIYSTSTLILNITGNLSIPSETQEYHYTGTADQCVRVANGGVLTIGGQLTVSGATRNSVGVGLRLNRLINGGWNVQSNISVASGGTLNLINAAIYSQASVQFAAGSTFNCTAGTFIFQRPTASPFNEPRLKFAGTVNVNGITLIGGAMVTIDPTTTVITQFSGFRHFQGGATISSFGAAANGATQSFVELTDFDGTKALNTGNIADLSLYAGSLFRIYGWGTATAPIPEVQTWALGRDMLVELRRRVSVSAVNANGPIDGGVVYLKSVNNGARQNATINTVTTIDYVAGDDVYIAQTVAGALASPFDVLCYVGGARSVSLVYTWTWQDYRHSGGMAFANTVHLWHYGSLYASSDVSLRGNGSLSVSLAAVVDSNATLSESAAAALTTIDTAEKFYCRAKWFKTRNIQANLETGGISNYIVTRSGNLINAGAYNVTIDAAAAQAFSVAGNTITIKAGIYTGDMTTTGVITLANGAQFVGTRTDANGTIAPPVLQSVTVSNGVSGTLLLIQDVTNPSAPVTLYLGTPASWPHTWTDSADYAADRDIRVRAAYRSGATAKLFVDELIGTSTYAAPALAYRLNQQDDTVYNTRAQDGSTVSGITINDVALLIEVTTGSIEWGALYAYEVYWLATAAGIIDEGRIITALDAANYVFEGAWKIKNVSTPSVPLVITGGWGRSASDNTTQSLIDTTGGPIFAAPDQVYVTTITTSSGVVTGDISEVQGLVQSGMTAQGYTTARAAQLDIIEAAPTVPTAAANAAAVRAELATELARVDVAVSTRNATAPDNVGIAAIKAKTDSLVNGPTLAEIEGSTLAKDATVTTAQAAIIAEIDAIPAPTVPAAQDNADAVRAELAAELARIQEIAVLHGLVPSAPLSVSDTQRTAGTIVQTITESDGTTTVTRVG